MKILALIPARGGSKRLPKKNTLLLGEKPLINWSIDVVKNIPEICNILVSTDDETVANIAKNSGALVPWLRPSYLSEDDSKSADVALHAIEWYERNYGFIDGLLLLQPTSPFRTRKTILDGIKIFKLNPGDSVVAISPIKQHPMWSVKIENNKVLPYLEYHGFGKRFQDLPTTYIINGCLYLISPKDLHLYKSFVNPNTRPLIISSRHEDLDIDDQDDFNIAKYYVKNK